MQEFGLTEDENKGFGLCQRARLVKRISLRLRAARILFCVRARGAQMPLFGHALKIYYFVNPLSTHSAAFEWQFSFLCASAPWMEKKRRRERRWWKFLLHKYERFIHNAFLLCSTRG
jgi:hypothetical protein